MKKIILVDASPRVKGNSENIIDILSEDLQGHQVILYKMREKKTNFCLACDACQGKNTQKCVQGDDYAALLPDLDTCDAIVIATPIYNQQITAMAKSFIERLYPFFKMDDPLMSNTSKRGKKAALVCSFWGSPLDVTEKYAQWTVKGMCQMGCQETKTLLFTGIPGKGDILKHQDYVEQVHQLAQWLVK